MWSFTLPIDLSSANMRIVNGRHAATAAMYRRRRDTWVSWMCLAARHAGLPFVGDAGRTVGLMYVVLGDGDVAKWRRRVTIVRLMGRGQRAFDDDNIAAACKGLRDAMQRPRTYGKRMKFGGRTSGLVVQVPIAGAGIVWDDSCRWSEWRYAQERAADGRPGVRVTVEDIEHRPEPGRTES